VRRRLFRELAHEDGELALFLGDVVAYDAPHHWQRIDPLLDRLRARGVALAAAVGNHDVFPVPRRGMASLARRGLVPPHRTYQERDVGNVRFVVLDSNRRVLGERRGLIRSRGSASVSRPPRRAPTCALSSS
jgi:hypothetical protein